MMVVVKMVVVIKGIRNPRVLVPGLPAMNSPARHVGVARPRGRKFAAVRPPPYAEYEYVKVQLQRVVLDKSFYTYI